MGFLEAVKSVFKNYANFSGRACRSELWYFVLFCGIAGFISGIVDQILFQDFVHTYRFGPIGIGLLLVIFLPRLTVAVRRLHDLNRSGWWIFIAATIIGLIPLIYWYCKAGDTGNNRFGADPLAEKVKLC